MLTFRKLPESSFSLYFSFKVGKKGKKERRKGGRKREEREGGKGKRKGGEGRLTDQLVSLLINRRIERLMARQKKTAHAEKSTVKQIRLEQK